MDECCVVGRGWRHKCVKEARLRVSFSRWDGRVDHYFVCGSIHAAHLTRFMPDVYAVMGVDVGFPTVTSLSAMPLVGSVATLRSV